MTRIGYDSDTGRYSFRDKDGSIWEGPEGAEYGEMRKGVYNAGFVCPPLTGFPQEVSQGPAMTDDEDVESGQPLRVRFDGYSPIPSETVSTNSRISPQGQR